ncbi:hypothetical protein [Halomonas denitrificans]|nr:hypothetical protein [Halomonas denitrificans]
MVLHALRRRSSRVSRVLAMLFVVLWAAIVATPCVMAMQAEPEPHAAHDCPHCPPTPCHEPAAPADCDETDPADRLRSADTSPFAVALPGDAPATPPAGFAARLAPAGAHALSRDGPRPHLLHVRFDE